MPLAGSAPALSSAIRAKLVARSGWVKDNADLTAFCDDIASAVVDHLIANTIVSPLGVPPMTTAMGPVGGFGVLT